MTIPAPLTPAPAASSRSVAQNRQESWAADEWRAAVAAMTESERARTDDPQTHDVMHADGSRA